MKAPRSDSNTKILSRLYLFVLVGMAFTGFGQMPIFNRYYVSEIPGMGWAADFYLTHTIHYLGAIVLFALFAYAVTDYLLAGKSRARLTASAYVRLALLGIKQKFQNKGIDAIFVYESYIQGEACGFQTAEMSLIIEDNHKLLNMLDHWGAPRYKTFRIYEKEL